MNDGKLKENPVLQNKKKSTHKVWFNLLVSPGCKYSKKDSLHSGFSGGIGTVSLNSLADLQSYIYRT